MKRIDLNCDLGEGGGHDEALMPLITSANIACGGHAGDEVSMRQTVMLAKSSGVAIGAHPGYADPEFFGRRQKSMSPDEVFQLVGRQVETLRLVAEACGARLAHVKPHGALYNQAWGDPRLADAIARAVQTSNPRLVLFGPAGSELIAAGIRLGLRVASEVFADRNYAVDGTLVPRHDPHALIEDEAVATKNILRILHDGEAVTWNGTYLPMRADTVCVHGDGGHSVALLRGLRRALEQACYAIKPVPV